MADGSLCKPVGLTMLNQFLYASNSDNLEPQTGLVQAIKPRVNAHDHGSGRLLISLVVPAYNEAVVLETNLSILCDYMRSLECEYDWEIIVVNDGSRDDTGILAEAFAHDRPNVHVVHHLMNGGLGQALKTGFQNCHGKYIVTLDLDLSYAPEHIEQLLTKIRSTGAKVVVASPYMPGGKVSNVPWLRRTLSIWANRFLWFASKQNFTTLTGMVRVYDAEFVQKLHLKSSGMEVNPEILHKARIMEERVTEIPAHLHWHIQKSVPKGNRRKSSMKLFHHTWAILFFGFLFRPVMFFIIPSLIFFALSCFANAWVLIHCWTNFQRLASAGTAFDPTIAVAAAFQQAPHTFVIGGMLLMLSIQLFSLGVLSMQSKQYFEEIYLLSASIYQATQKSQESSV